MWRGLDHYGRRHVINPLAVHEFKSRWIAFSWYRLDIGCDVVKERKLNRDLAGIFCDTLGPR